MPSLFMIRLVVCCAALLALAGAAHAQTERPFERTIDHVYATIDGVDFYMDVFVPNGAKIAAFNPSESGKGLAIVDIASGGWQSDRGKIRDHETAKMYDIFCARGYTVFAVRPGTRGKYTCFEMVDHVKAAIRYVKQHAETYSIDPDRIGLTGASAGGHLGLLTALTATPETAVRAAGIFFPPTDFLNWEGKQSEAVAEAVGDILFKDGVAGRSKEEVDAMARKASPINYVQGKTIPIIIFHGDADTIVPLQQSEIFVEKLKSVGSPVELVVEPGGGHPWLTIPLEVMELADWFDKNLSEAKK